MGARPSADGARGDDTYLDSLLGLLAHIKGMGRNLVAGVKDGSDGVGYCKDSHKLDELSCNSSYM